MEDNVANVVGKDNLKAFQGAIGEQLDKGMNFIDEKQKEGAKKD